MGPQVAADAVVVQTTGEVLDGACDYVRRQVAAFARRLPGPLLQARVKLAMFSQSSAVWSTLTQANLEADGRPIRTQVAAAFFREPGRLLRVRLGEQVTRLADPAIARPWLARLATVAPSSAPVSVPLTVNVHKVPQRTAEQAVHRLNAHELPFRFFRDASTDRGAVLYRRYHGHCGLITPGQSKGRHDGH